MHEYVQNVYILYNFSYITTYMYILHIVYSLCNLSIYILYRYMYTVLTNFLPFIYFPLATQQYCIKAWFKQYIGYNKLLLYCPQPITDDSNFRNLATPCDIVNKKGMMNNI